MILENINMIKKLIDLFKKYSRFFSSLGLVSGLIITPFTLTRIDELSNNLWIIIQIIIAVLGIVVLNYLENKIKVGKISQKYSGSINFWFALIIQFAFGNLFSTYITFYFRSSTIFLSWPFILIIFALLIGNEIWVKHYSRLTLQLTTLFLSLYMFLIFFLPVAFNRIGNDIFIYSGISSLIFIFVLVLILFSFSREKFIKSKKGLVFSILGTYIIVNGMYFLNIIPPLPLSVKEAGIYYGISKVNGEYIFDGPIKTWKDYFSIYETFYKKENKPVYVFTSIFSPTKFNQKIIHEWQYYDVVYKEWVVSSVVYLDTLGGRDEGYRTYSMKENIYNGKWRVNVLTLNKRVIGRVNFEVK